MSREYVHAQYWHNTVVINTGTISAVDFDIDSSKKEFLREIGYRTAKEIIPIKLKSVLSSQTVLSSYGFADKKLV